LFTIDHSYPLKTIINLNTTLCHIKELTYTKPQDGFQRPMRFP
jgi:hypothetical protein